MNRKNPKCISKDYTAQFTINILTHIAFLIFILTMVFSFYTEKIMTNSVNSQINKIINENLNNSDYIKQITSILTTLGYEPKKYFDIAKRGLLANNSREKHNNLVKNILYICSFAILFTVIFTFIITKMLCTKIHLFDIIIENVIIFFFIGIIELLFFKFIILKYIPAYPSDIKNKLLDELKKY